MNLTYGPRPSALPAPYELRVVERFAQPGFSELSRKLFSFSAGIHFEEVAPEPDGLKDARARTYAPWRLRLGVYVGDDLVGWAFGWQDARDSFYMGQSAVRPEHRRKGLYTALMLATMEIARERGFHLLHSKHVCTNRAILIAKLKAGFHITGMSLHPAWGVMALMEFPLSQVREEALLTRSGLARPTARIADAFAVAPEDV